MADLLRKPASILARMVREGEVTSRELVEASLERIEAVNPALNAYTLVDADNALSVAGDIHAGDERPFAGVPIAIKDLFAPVAGLRSAHGSDLLGEWTPDYDYALVRRFREAGFVIVGKTATPEFGVLPVTEPRRFGPTRNPWDTERTPGGSSGGSAAAVASGTVPLAHASDGGGSIRIPAACCGLVGLKPTRNRISRAPDLGQHFLSTDGVLTRTVADTAELLDVMAGYEPGDAAWAPPPLEPFADIAAREPGKLRIGLTMDMPIEADLDPVCEAAARDAAELLTSLGHEVTEVDAPWKENDLFQIFSVLWAANVGASVMHGGLVTGTEVTEESVEPLSWWLYQMGLERSAIELVGAQAMIEAFARQAMSLWATCDVVLTPALAERPVLHGKIDPMGDNPAYEFKKSGEFTPYTATFNVTGQPAISLPLFHGDDNLPLGVQLAGPPAGEGVLLQLAAQLEAARPWADRAPPEPV
ncbi:MAG: amidase [Thermoleophilaceae bacterium]|nr:amidase [Thermoleophilaceae bacterium]